MSSGDSYTTSWKYLKLFNYICKNGKNGKFYAMNILHSKNKIQLLTILFISFFYVLVLVFALLLSYWWWWLFLASIFFKLKKYDYKIKKIFIFLNLQDNYWTISFPPSHSLSQTSCTHTHSIPYKMNLENSLFWNSSKKVSLTNSVILTSKLVMNTQICLIQGNLLFNGQICTNDFKIILTHSKTEDIMRQLSEILKT